MKQIFCIDPSYTRTGICIYAKEKLIIKGWKSGKYKDWYVYFSSFSHPKCNFDYSGAILASKAISDHLFSILNIIKTNQTSIMIEYPAPRSSSSPILYALGSTILYPILSLKLPIHLIYCNGINSYLNKKVEAAIQELKNKKLTCDVQIVELTKQVEEKNKALSLLLPDKVPYEEQLKKLQDEITANEPVIAAELTNLQEYLIKIQNAEAEEQLVNG